MQIRVCQFRRHAAVFTFTAGITLGSGGLAKQTLCECQSHRQFAATFGSGKEQSMGYALFCQHALNLFFGLGLAYHIAELHE